MAPLILVVGTLALATGLLIAAFWLVMKRLGAVRYASGILTAVLGLPLVIAATALALLADTSTLFGPSIVRADLKVVELGYYSRQMDIAGDRWVGIGVDREVYLANVRTGDVRQLTDDGHRKWQPVVSGDTVAWIDEEDEERGNHIFVLDLSTGEQRRITNTPRRFSGLHISGHRLVWQENGEDRHSDIYAYDLETDEEIAIAVALGEQRLGGFDGGRIIWSDDRGDAHWGTNPFGCPDCPDTRSGIYMYDFAFGERLLVTEHVGRDKDLDIHGSWVVWQGDDTVRLYDLDTCQTRTLASPGSYRIGGPLVSGDYVVWTVSWPCDVFPMPTDVTLGAFAYDLRTDEVLQLSDFADPSIVIDGDVVAIYEGCLGGGTANAVFLPE